MSSTSTPSDPGQINTEPRVALRLDEQPAAEPSSRPTTTIATTTTRASTTTTPSSSTATATATSPLVPVLPPQQPQSSPDPAPQIQIQTQNGAQPHLITESPVDQPPPPPPRVARNISSATLGSADRVDGEATQSHTPPDARLNRHATYRSQRPRTGDSARRALDWVVPVEERPAPRHTVEQRLGPTLEHAIKERDKLKMKARTAKWSINVAAGLQIFLGTLTTGLSAIRLNGQKFGVATTVLGIMSTLTGSYLARVRAADEPESSLIRAHDLDAFIRDCEAFRLDYGYDTGDKYDHQIEEFRRRFEYLLGNIRAEAVKARQKPAAVEDKAKSIASKPPPV